MHESELHVFPTQAEPGLFVQEEKMLITTTVALARSQYDNLKGTYSFFQIQE